MKITIIQDSALNESLALSELVGYAKQFDCVFDLFIQKEEKYFDKKILNSRPDIILLPSDLGGHHWAHKMADYLKKLTPVPIITGGSYPTFFPDNVIKDQNFDFIIRGESEIPFVKFIDAYRNNKKFIEIPGLWGRNNDGIFKNEKIEVLKNLDDLPLPDKSIYYKYPFIKNFKLKRILSGRGCVGQCSFCLNPLLKKDMSDDSSFQRKKSVQKVIDEILHIRSNTVVQSIHFADDQFVSSLIWLSEFAEIYPKTVGLNYTCNLRIQDLTPQNIELLKKSGCSGVAIGIETGNEDIRSKLLNKNYSNEELIFKAKILAEKKIKLVTFNMLSIPGETIEDSLKTIKLNRDIKAFNARLSLAYVIPKTNLFKYTEKYFPESMMKNESVEMIPDFKDAKNFICNVKNHEKFFNLFMLFQLGIHFKIFMPVIRFFAYRKYLPFLKIFSFFSIFFEKTFFNIDFISGFRMFLHTGNPSKRSKNMHALI